MVYYLVEKTLSNLSVSMPESIETINYCVYFPAFFGHMLREIVDTSFQVIDKLKIILLQNQTRSGFAKIININNKLFI
tara:strand:+ start:114 stop:347 length:234 start_codon:yes stop_codon:yes gene_type:complete